MSNKTSPSEVATEIRRSTVDLILLGLTLIAVSVVIPHGPIAGYFKDLAKETGVAVASVFSIKLVYEQRIAHKHFQVIVEHLRLLLEQGDSNAKLCAKLGILEIFATRDRYEEKYSLFQLVSSAKPGTRLRITGLTLFLLATKLHILKKSLEQGAQWELCFLDPKPYPHLKSPHMKRGDLCATIERLQELTKWLQEQKPAGCLEVRTHQVALFDSYSLLPFSDGARGVWDLGFGPDVTQKRILLVDPEKELGRDLGERYDRIWKEESTHQVLLYQNGAIQKDELTSLLQTALAGWNKALTTDRGESHQGERCAT